MTTADITVLSQPDVVTRLHAAFGGLRSWAYFLTDCILDRTSLKGLQLLPVAYLQGRCKRPVYARPACWSVGCSVAPCTSLVCGW